MTVTGATGRIVPSTPHGRGCCRPRLRRVAVDAALAGAVAGLLAQRWSPEQVAHELRVLFAGQRRRWLCVESIYQAIYDSAVELTRPRRRRRRRRRLAGLHRRGRLPAMTMIHERPTKVEDRAQLGHWEGDLIVGPTQPQRYRDARPSRRSAGRVSARSSARSIVTTSAPTASKAIGLSAAHCRSARQHHRVAGRQGGVRDPRAFGLVTLVLAVAADMGMSLLVTLNAMRLLGRSTANTGTRPAGPVDPCTEDCCSNE